jgi:hypothetical protein
MSINLVQWEGSTVTPKLDAIMYDDGSYGIIKGCAITHQGTNLLKIANGFIKIAGRLIEIAEETIQCQVSESGTVNGQLWIRLDLSSVTPAVFMTEAAAVLTPLTQNADCNFQNGIYELQLATYNIDESVITNLVETAPELERLRTALENIDLAANKVTYDNTHSGLSANKVQGAIDEINDNLAQTPITVGGETLSTIDDKLNYLCEAQKLEILDVSLVHQSGSPGGDYTSRLKFDVSKYTSVKLYDVVASVNDSIAYWRYEVDGVATAVKTTALEEIDVSNAQQLIIQIGTGAGSTRCYIKASKIELQ